jgi:surfeit locus 1 family protein
MRKHLIPTVMTLCGAALLFALGTWQLQRLAWKSDIIERLEAGYAAGADAPLLRDDQLSAWSAEEAPIGYGRVEGRLLRDKSILLGPRTEGGRAGYHLLIPMQREGGRILIINAGWVDALWQDTLDERLSQLPAGEVVASGAIQRPDWSSFASKNAPAQNMWFRADIAEIATAKGLDNPYPLILYAHAITPPLPDVMPRAERWLPRNKHLQYALFWYALCLSLIGVYGFYLYSARKNNEGEAS